MHGKVEKHCMSQKRTKHPHHLMTHVEDVEINEAGFPVAKYLLNEVLEINMSLPPSCVCFALMILVLG